MQDRDFSKREVEDELGWIASGDELEAYLERIAPYIGWVTIYFNSLEDHISDFIRMAVLRDPFQDERLDVFLSGMMFAGKAQALIDLYGQMISSAAVQKTDKELKELQELLNECARRRNEYVHADWIGVREGSFVRVKSTSKRTGITHRYRVFEDSKLQADVDFICEARFILNKFNDEVLDQLARGAQ
jgi:hypothetical protein